MSLPTTAIPAQGAATPSPERFRQEFPSLQRVTHLVSCSEGARSKGLTASMERMLGSMDAQGAPWPEWMHEVERARDACARLIGAAPQEIALVPNASVGAFQVASTLSFADRPGLVTTEMEFPSVAHVWLAQRQRGARVEYVRQAGARVDAEGYLSAVDETTRLVSVPLVSYRNGHRLPVEAVARRAREVGARVFVDAYQAAGVIRIDVDELDCDYLVAGHLKYLLGLPGLAFVYVRDGVADDIDPQLTGWFGRADPFAFDPTVLDFPPHARRYETGTPAVPAVYAANAGLDLLAGLDMAAVERHVRSLAAELAGRLRADGERLWQEESDDGQGPVVAMFDDEPERLAAWLADRDVFTSPRGPVVRMSLHYYNLEADLDTLTAAVRAYRTGWIPG